MKKPWIDLDDCNNLVFFDPDLGEKSAPFMAISDWRNGFRNDDPSATIYQTSALLDKRANQLFKMQNSRLSSWFSTIPALVLRLARLSHRPFGVLMLAAADEYALQLLRQSTVLFFLLLEAAFENSWSRQKFCQSLRKKRAILIQEILGKRLHRPHAVLKFIHRVDLVSFKPGDLERLVATITSDDYRRFEHHKVVPLDLVTLTGTCPAVTHMDWLFQAAEDERRKSIAIIKRLQKMYLDYPIRGPSINDLKEITSYDKLCHYLDLLKSMVDEIRQFQQQYPFPEPPILGNRFLQPVTDAYTLYELGEEQHNCVFDCLEEIMKGRYYVYRVELGEVMTLGLKISSENLVMVDELLGPRNREVDIATHDFVGHWIKTSDYAKRHVWHRRWVSESRSVQYNRVGQHYDEYLSRSVHSVNQHLFRAGYKAYQNDQIMSEYSRYCNSA